MPLAGQMQYFSLLYVYFVAEQLNGGFHHVLDLGRACSVHMQEKKAKNNSGVCKIHTHINIQPLTCLCIEPDLRW